LKGRQSFTLIELVLVITILSIGFASLLLVMRYASVNASETHFTTIAHWLCQEKMEGILSDRRDNGFSYITSANYPDENPVSGFSNFTRTTEIYYVNLSNLNTDTGSSTDYKRIQVTVSGAKAPTSVRLWTIVSDY